MRVRRMSFLCGGEGEGRREEEKRRGNLIS